MQSWYHDVAGHMVLIKREDVRWFVTVNSMLKIVSPAISSVISMKTGIK